MHKLKSCGLLLALFLMLEPLGRAAEPVTVVLVRHAEKANLSERDPLLSPAGEARAQALAASLAEAGVTAIITTQFRRTQLTAAPLATRLGLTPVTVPITREGLAAHVQAVVAAVQALPGPGVVLVVGHSNSLGPIVAALSGPAIAEICESEFSHFLVLPQSGPQLLHLHYGTADASPASGCQ